MRLIGIVAWAVVCIGVVTSAAGQNQPAADSVPGWLGDSIWYQVFVERFRNGDVDNDPTAEDMEGAWPRLKPAGWRTTPWGHDWYEQEGWATATGRDFYTTVQLRRYGGDLQGVLDQLEYLQELGVTALYLNPINDSPSLHKYDARNYRHVDRNFGPDPRGDAQIMLAEDPVDPTTWQWTAADQLLLKLIREVHRRDMRIIIDYSWNHTGVTFWAWRDIIERQSQSPFAPWYAIERFDDPTTPASEFSYRGWAGVRQLPEFSKTQPRDPSHTGPAAGDLHPALKRHIFAVTRRWLDPNGDGDCSDGVDGFRLDVAELLPLTFLRDYKDFVASIHPDAALIAELWWDEWPDRMQDPAPWIQAGAFHAVMNYRWYAPSRSFFAVAPPFETVASLGQKLLAIEEGIPSVNLKAMMNVAATHDTPRLATSLQNRGQYKFRVSPKGNADYRIERPSTEVRARQRLLLVQQFTWTGAPHIYYGDEVGMWGADDPDCRKPMIWSDLEYRPERRLPNGAPRPEDRVAPDRDLFEFYQRLIALRKQHSRLLARGSVELLPQDEASTVFVYQRKLGEQRLVVALNRSASTVEAFLPVKVRGRWRDLLDPDAHFDAAADGVTVTLPPFTARILAPNEPDR